MNKFFKILFDPSSIGSYCCSNCLRYVTFKTSQDAFESSQDSKNANRQSNLRDNKVNPEEQPISILS